MALGNTEEGWGWLSRLFHWVIGLGILGLFAVGFYMVNILGESTDPYAVGERIELTQLHKSFGTVVFSLIFLRLIWRWANPTPRLPEMPRWQVTASHASHLALYALMATIPVTGWLMATSSPLNDADAYPMQIKNEVFGLFALPDPYPEGDKALSELFGTVHEIAGWMLMAVVIIHVLAALKHHFLDRDRVLMRMIRGR